jgi:peptide/nickel transport system substrate-binding protein
MALVVIAGTSLLPGAGRGQAPAPSAADLLKSEPFDQITLIDNTVLRVEPISPRPLPEYDAKAERARRAALASPRQSNVVIKGNRAELLPEKNGGEAGPAQEITIKPIGEEAVYRVRRGSIKEDGIVYFEDMLLAAGETLVREKDFARAFEHYLLVKERAGTWRGLEEHVEQLLYAEGVDALQSNQVEKGLRLLRELHERRADYPGLADQLAKAYGGRIERSLNAGAYADGRRVLHELDELAPDHLVVREMRGRYIARAKALADRASRDDPAARLDDLAAALRVWPALEGAAGRYREAFAALPTLEVAVADLPRPVGPWVRTPADARASRLLYLPLLAAEDEEATQGRRTDQLAAGVVSSDIGRRLTITLREGPAWNDGSGPVSAIDVIRSLSERAQPASPRYQARWAHLLQRIEAPDGRQVVVDLLRTPLKPGAWLLGPVGPAHAGRDGRVPGPGGTRRPVGAGPFAVGPVTPASLAYLAVDRDTAASMPRVRRIVERRIADGSAALTALRRGEVSLVEHVPPDQVAALSREPEIKLGRHAQPRLHLLALDGRAPALRNRTLRRALAYAIDRKAILEEAVLGRPMDETNRLSNGAFAADSYAKAHDVRPLGHDPLMARMLAAAAKRELGEEKIKLTFEYADVPAVRAAVPRIVEGLTAAGLEIQAVARAESDLESELRDGRRFEIAYRAASCVEPVADVGPLLCPGYDAPPSADGLAAVASPRILQLLMQLESASEFPTARGLVIQIDREVRDELPVVPLWQVDDYYAWRARLKGPAEAAEHLYQGIDTWEIEPWFARDPW